MAQEKGETIYGAVLGLLNFNFSAYSMAYLLLAMYYMTNYVT